MHHPLLVAQELENDLQTNIVEVDKLRCLAQEHRVSRFRKVSGSSNGSQVSVGGGGQQSPRLSGSGPGPGPGPADPARALNDGPTANLPNPPTATAEHQDNDQNGQSSASSKQAISDEPQTQNATAPQQAEQASLLGPLEPVLEKDELGTSPQSPLLPRKISAQSTQSLRRTSSPGDFGDCSRNRVCHDNDDVALKNHRVAVSAPTIHDDELSQSDESYAVDKIDFDEATIKQMMEALGKNCFTSKYSEEERRALAVEMRLREVEEDEIVIHQGEKGDRLYISATGSYEMIQNGVPRPQLIGPYVVIGEMAILYRCHRTATIRSKMAGALYYIDLEHFHHVLYVCASEMRKVHAEFLKNIELMQGLADSYINKISEVVIEKSFGKGQIVLEEQVDAEHFYILVEGEVLVMETNDQRSRRPVPLATLYTGSHFGARGLLEGQVSSRVYKSLSDTTRVLLIDRIAFHELIVPLEALGRLKSHDNFAGVHPTPLSENVHAKIKLNDLQTEGTLGVGGFGQVDLVSARGFTEKFAIKKLSKEHIVQNSQEEHVLNEKRVLECLNSPFCISLLATFKDDRYVYLMMNSCLGGELWLHLKHKGSFRESAARFYVASVIEGLAYVHSIGYVYRDLKPENLMLDSTGYVKIVDFGFAKKIGRNEKTWTFCGTPDYMAPEIVMNHGHDFGADLWSVGVLIFELLCGRPPFAAKDPMDTYNKIILGIDRAKFPRHFPEAARSLITALCRECSTERLGNLHEGMAGIRTHRWFDGFEWPALHQHKLDAPMVPQTVQVQPPAAASTVAVVGPLDWDEEF